MDDVAEQSVAAEGSIWAKPRWAHRLTPTPVPFCLPLVIVDSQTAYFIERGRGRVFAAALMLIPAVFALFALLMVIELVVDREESWLASEPEAISGFVLLLCFTMGFSALAAWLYCIAVGQTRELVFSGDRVSLRWLNWRGRVWRNHSASLAECAVQVHPARLVSLRHKSPSSIDPGTPVAYWTGWMLVFHVAGERFVVAALKKRKDVEAHFQKLPGILRALSRGEGDSLEGMVEVRVSSAWRKGPRPSACQVCGYDLSGLAADGRVCPECGVEG